MPDNSSDDIAVLVRFEWGPFTARYTSWASSIIWQGEVYSPLPELEVQYQPIQGGTDDDWAEVTMSKSIAPADTLADPYPHARVKCEVWHTDPADPSVDRTRRMHTGKVSRVKLNPAGRSGLVVLRIESVLAEANRKLGFSATVTCPWVFGDSSCKVDVESKKVSTKVGLVEVDKERARIRVGAAIDPKKLKRGFVEVEGLSLLIRQAFARPSQSAQIETDLDLVSPPPPRWLGKDCVVTPGCDKQLSTCKEVWDNESEFGGVGFGMPPRNPLLEVE